MGKIIVKYSNQQPDDDDEYKGVDFSRLLSKKKKHKYERVQSVTRFELDGTAPCETITVVTIWRNENDLGPYYLSNMDLEEVVKGKVHHSDYRAVAEILIALPRVAAVEVVDYSSGSGIKIEN